MKDREDVIFIDFETRSFVDLKKAGAWVYSEDPTTDIICMGYSLNNNTPEIWIPGNEVPTIFKKHKGCFAAHHALFDYSIALNILVEQYNFPEYITDYTRWMCTRAMSVSCGLPGDLDSAGRVLSKVNESKDKKGSYLINKYSKPIKNRKTGKLSFKEFTHEDKQSMIQYCLQDVRVSQNIYYTLKDFPNISLEREIFLLDFKKNLQGIPVDISNTKKIVNALDKAKLEAEKKMVSAGVNVRSQPELILFLKKHNIDVKNIQASTIDHITNTSDDPEVLEICELRQFLGKASVKKFQTLLDRTGTDNTLKHYLMYYGAHTGRFSGKGFQPHNLPRSNTNIEEINSILNIFNGKAISFKEIVPLAKKVLPAMIKANDGMVFLKGDFSSVEARGVAYLAGQNDLVQKFKNNIDTYKEMAAHTLEKSINKITKEERFLGKSIILGSGYGMGWRKFKLTCEKSGYIITNELAEKSIMTYRTEYKKIPELWKKLTDAFLLSLKNKGTTYIINSIIEIQSKNKYITVKLPSGRYLYYHNIQIHDGEHGPELSYWNFLQNTRVKIWGGIITENIVQATCRDMLCHCMLEAEKHGLNPILQVHDEMLSHIAIKNLEQDKIKFEEIMNTSPAWLPGFPLKTEVISSERYYK